MPEKARALKRNASQQADEDVKPKESRTEEEKMEEEKSQESQVEEEDGEEKTPQWAKKFGNDMTSLLKEMKSVNLKVDHAVNTATEAKTAVVELKADMQTLRSDYNTFKEQVGDDVSAMVRKEIDKAMKERTGSDPDEEHPERLVIVSGFMEDTNEDDIESRLKKLIEDNSLQDRVVEVFCYTDPATSGVLKMRSEKARNNFLRSSRKLKDTAIDEDRMMKFSKKLTVDERAIEKRLGYIKNAVMVRESVGVKEVKIDWRKKEVEYKKVKVFQTLDKGERVYTGIGTDIKAEVEEKVKAWLDKRQHEDSD